MLLFLDVPVVTIASKKYQKTSDSPVPVEVIGEKEIRLSGASGIPELLRRVAGVDVLSVSASDHNVSIRGFNQQTSSRVLVLLDGRPVYLDFYGLVLWDALPVTMDGIRQIELVKGPGSSIYGGNAFNGVINIITKSPEEINGTVFSLAGGEYDTAGGSLLWGEKKGKTSWKMSVSRDEYDEWEENNSLKYSDSAFFMYGREIGAASSLSLSASINKSEGETMTSLDNFFREAEQKHVMLDFKSGDSLKMKFFWNGLDSEIEGERVLPLFESMSVVSQHQFDIDTDSYEAEVIKFFEIGKEDGLLLGANYRKNCLDSDMFDDDHEQEIFGFFSEAEFQLGSAVKATLGGRYDRHPLVDGNFSPRLGFLYKSDEKSVFRLSYSTAYGLPTFTQSYLHIERGLTPIVGNRELDVEKIESFNLGYSYFIARRGEAKIDLFYNEVEDIIRWPEDLSLDDRYRNVDSYTVRGAELSLTINMTHALDFRINYAFINIDYSNREENFNESPESKLNAGFDYQWGKFFGSFYAHYVSKTRWPLYASTLTAQYGYVYDKVIESYTVVNVNAGFNLNRHATFSIYGNNIFNERHKEDPLGDKTGRKIIARLKYRF